MVTFLVIMNLSLIEMQLCHTKFNITSVVIKMSNFKRKSDLMS